MNSGKKEKVKIYFTQSPARRQAGWRLGVKF